MARWFSRKPAPKAERVEPRPTPRAEPRLSFDAFARITEEREQYRQAAVANAYKPYQPPHGVRGAGMAMDSGIGLPAGFDGWAAASVGVLEGYIADGLNFQGYPYLAQMAQRAEFRKPVEVIVKECTREWIRLRSKKQGSDKDKTERDAAEKRIAELEDAMSDFGVREVAKQQITHALQYGIGAVWADVGNLRLDGTGQDVPLRLRPEGTKKGDLKRFAAVEPIWMTPALYDSSNPLRADFFKPSKWWVQGSQVDASRMSVMVPFPVSDMLKPAFNFGGLSLTQQIKSYVHNFLRLRNSVSAIAANFSKIVLQTNMFGTQQTPVGYSGSYPAPSMGAVDATSVIGRAGLLNATADGQDIFVTDKEDEDVKILATPLSGLSELLAQAQEAQAGMPGIPLVKLFGIQPTGLNASSDGEIRVFYDEIASFQESNVRPTLKWMLDAIQLHLWGEIDPDIDFEFIHLWQMDEKQAAEVEKIKTDIDAVNIAAGKLSPDEARKREAMDDSSIYRNVDLSGEAPELPEGEPDDGTLTGLLSKSEGEE